jgi:curved DNA-binding protein CbpA
MPSDPSNGDRMYQRLDLSPEASPEQIGRAYRRLAHGLHPDTHPEDPDSALRFREITEAYEILSDPARRARYDRNRQPPPTSDLAPPRPAANSNSDRITVTPVHGPGQPGQPMFIGLGPFRTGAAPLIAGPVHVASPTTPDRNDPGRSSGTELAQLIDAVLRAWRWW